MAKHLVLYLDGAIGACYNLSINGRKPQYLPLIKYDYYAYTFKEGRNER